MKLEEYKVILEREGFRRYDGDSYWNGENMFALIGCYNSLIILPDFKENRQEISPIFSG